MFGGISGIAPQWLDTLLMRLTEILLSVPNLLLVILLQAILGKPNVVTISVVIGVTSWTSIAKIVRTEVRQIRNSEYAIVSESTLSFMGIGLPLDHFLGKHALFVRKGAADRFMVDHSDSGDLPCRDVIVHDCNRK